MNLDLRGMEGRGVKPLIRPRTFRIRACPECGAVEMPHYRDDWAWCREHPPGEQPRLAWFDVEESDSRLNRLNAEAREMADPHKGYDEYLPSPGGAFVRNWATGETRSEEFS